MAKFLCRFIGITLCLFGILGMLTPIPLGLIFFIIGLMFLLPSTPGAANVVRKMRKNISIFDKAMTMATAKLPYPYRRILRTTEIDLVD